jgi:hypothetical protein
MQWHDGRRWQPCDTVTRGTERKSERRGIRSSGEGMLVI